MGKRITSQAAREAILWVWSLDFATNMNNGQWSKTDLANIYRDVIAKNDPGYTAFLDFAPYQADAEVEFWINPPLLPGC